jgi:hypothetical protein
MFNEARKLLLREHPSVARPARLEQFAECLALVALNGDGMVGSKVEAKGQKPLNIREREYLVRLAINETPWLNVEDSNMSFRNLKKLRPDLNFVDFDMNGADDVVKYEKWRFTGPKNRMITMGRPGSTQEVLQGMRGCAIDPDDGNCFLGPELPDISSTEARDLSAKGDQKELLTLLHPAVADWLLRNDGHNGLDVVVD